jgi:hypothetical protein
MKIKFISLALLLMLGLFNSAFAASVPQYSDYATALMCKKKMPLALDFSSDKKAVAFRSRLEAVANDDPNFAGHYILTSWGCGTFCEQLAIIDVETGKVYMPQINNPAWENYLIGWSYETPHADSKLLIVNAQLTTVPRSDPNALKGKFRREKAYYKWENNKLILLQ